MPDVESIHHLRGNLHGPTTMNTAFRSSSQSLKEAIGFADGKPGKAIVHHLDAPDIKRIRTDIGMTQTQFAATFGISVSTLHHWERGDRTPHGPALTLLNVLAREPRGGGVEPVVEVIDLTDINGACQSTASPAWFLDKLHSFDADQLFCR